MALKTFAAGESLAAADVNDYLVNSIFARKTADESVTSSTTLQDDDQLTVSVVANATYEVLSVITVSSASSTPDLKFQFVAPSGSSMGLGAYWLGTLQHVDLTTVVAVNIGAETRPVVLSGLLVVGATAGTFKLQWAQNASNATATTLKTGSYLWLQRVA